MIPHTILAMLSFMLFAMPAAAGGGFDMDTIKTSGGDLGITFIGHASLMFSFGGTVVQIDPWGKLADYSKMPRANLVLVTHDHSDHLDAEAIKALRTESTVIVASGLAGKKIPGSRIMKNGDVETIEGIRIEAVPAYNIEHMRSPGKPFHPPGEGNGYILTFGDRRVYVAGDTENIPEMKSLKDVCIAFLPMNLPYTMTPEMAADAARALRPKILYPYHFGETDTSKLTALLKDSGIEVRIRNMP